MTYNMKLVLLISSLAVIAQAIPESAILDEAFVQVVELPSLKRNEGERKYKLQAFGQEIDLDLKRTEGLLPTNLPVYVYGEDEEGNPTIDNWTHRTDGFQQLYTDKKMGSSLMVEEVEGETKMSGMVTDELIIEPVTDITLGNTEKRDNVQHVRHVIYKVKKQDEDTSAFDFEYTSESLVAGDGQEGTEKRALPERIWVPVHVVVDYSMWKKQNKPESEVIRYLKIFYNEVNSLYSSMSYPSVTVSIHGITICKSASACSMVENNRLGSDGVNAKTALSAISNYAYDQRSTIGEDFALMIVMTDYDLCSPRSSGTCERSTAGLAYVGTACGEYRFSKTSKTGIAEDHGAFDGIKTITHEMGHILGMNHDGDGPASSGAPGARSCNWDDNYIMGHTAFVQNQFYWSQCSVDQLRWLAVQPKASCLLTKPSSASRYPLINKLPGKELDIDNQCKIFFGPSSENGCTKPGINSGNDKLCTGLMCKTSTRGCSSETPAAEGSYCGPQRYCQKGKCVCDPTAPAPTPIPRDPTCRGDTPRIMINGQSCTSFLSGPNGLSNCESGTVKTHCCESRIKYCKADAISCDGSAPVTQKPTRPPGGIFVAPKTTTEKPYVPPSGVNCGKPCSDTPNMRINGQTCSVLLGTYSGKTQYCDNPTIVDHCCSTRQRVCDGYHSITESCDPSCQDNAGMRINGKKCVQFLSTTSDRENFCDADITKQHCCATRRKVCNGNSVFGK